MSETLRYPVIVDIKFQITDGDLVGELTFVMPVGRLPTEAEMPSIIERVRATLPPGFRLMNRAESTMQYLRDVKGYRGENLVIPPLDEDERWFDPETDVDWTDLNNRPEEAGDFE